jgi:hypothetical protein
MATREDEVLALERQYFTAHRGAHPIAVFGGAETDVGAELRKTMALDRL